MHIVTFFYYCALQILLLTYLLTYLQQTEHVGQGRPVSTFTNV